MIFIVSIKLLRANEGCLLYIWCSISTVMMAMIYLIDICRHSWCIPCSARFVGKMCVQMQLVSIDVFNA